MMGKMNAFLTLVLAWAMVGVPEFVGVAVAQTPSHFEDQNLLASDGAAGDSYGQSVSISGNVTIVGARNDDTLAGILAGSAYFYRFNGSSWVEESHVFASNGVARDHFGESVSISNTPGNEVAIVGAEGDFVAAGPNTGSAYIYRFNGTSWIEEVQLFASDGAATDFFGGSVFIQGNVAIVGAQLDDTAAGTDAGSAYIYRFNGSTWIEEAHLLASDGAVADQYGNSVSLSGAPGSEVAIVGAYLDNTIAGTNAGSAYIYRFNGTTWVEESHLFPFDASEASQFGDAVAIHQDVALIGASFDDSLPLVNSGAAYVFRYDGLNWNFETPLTASDAMSQDWFGRSVSISGTPGSEIALVGALRDDAAGVTDAGSAYVYHFNGSTWVEEQHLIASNAANINNFGISVSVSGAVAIVGGSDVDTIGGTDAGSAYIYSCVGDCGASAILNPGQQSILNPLGGSGIPTEDALVDVTNISGATGATVTVSETNTNQFPGASGFGVFDTQLIVNTMMNDGEFFMQVSIPFGQIDLDAASITDPLSIDMTYYNTVSASWELAVDANTVNSPGFGGPAGDRFAVTDTVIPALSTDLGDYGVYWNPVILQGFAWANVDHTTVYAAGIPSIALPCPGDVSPPSDGIVDVTDLLTVLAQWGTAGPEADTDNSGIVDVGDLLTVLGAWGSCP